MNKSTLYRVWDNKNELWLEHALLSTSGELYVLTDSEEMQCIKLQLEMDRYTINRRLSMTDINNKQIFEDDIIKAENDDCVTIGVVKYASPQYVLVCTDNTLPISYFEKCEVIGNIREQSDLVV